MKQQCVGKSTAFLNNESLPVDATLNQCNGTYGIWRKATCLILREIGQLNESATQKVMLILFNIFAMIKNVQFLWV